MTGYKSKKKAAMDKLVVTDLDGHVVRDVRKPKKVVALDRDAEIERLKSAPPQRTWVDLEIKEVDLLCEKYKDQPYVLYVEIRNLLKEKNT